MNGLAINSKNYRNYNYLRYIKKQDTWISLIFKFYAAQQEENVNQIQELPLFY